MLGFDQAKPPNKQKRTSFRGRYKILNVPGGIPLNTLIEFKPLPPPSSIKWDVSLVCNIAIMWPFQLCTNTSSDRRNRNLAQYSHLFELSLILLATYRTTDVAVITLSYCPSTKKNAPFFRYAGVYVR